jgi:hypothetical protein
MPNARNAQRKAIHMLQRSFTTNSRNQPHTQSSQTISSSRGGKKGLDTTDKRAKKHKTHKLPLNTCTRAKEHTKLTLSIHDRAKSTLSTQSPLNSCIRVKELTKLTLHTWDRTRSETNQVACWRKICTLRQAHSKPNKLASHAKRFQGVPVNFPWKLTKDKVVKFQSLELAGWYQTVPYLRL